MLLLLYTMKSKLQCTERKNSEFSNNEYIWPILSLKPVFD